MRDAEAEASEERKQVRVGAFLECVQEAWVLGELVDGGLTDIRLKLPTEEDPSTLLILRARAGPDRHIAFIGAFSVVDALLAWMARATKGRMKWREDVPWDQRVGG